jgi:regulator of replication initiation timing
MKMIKRYLVNPEGQIIESKIGWAIKVKDAQELEKAIDALIEERDAYHEENEKLREERDQAIEILQSWADDESPWTETWAFLARISKDKEKV